MEELNLVDLLQYYLKKLPFIVAAAVIAIILGTVYILKIQVPLYHGTTSIVLVQRNNSENTNFTQTELTLGEKLVTTYSEIIKSKRVLSQVISELNLNVSVEELARKISVNSLKETAIIKIVVSDENAIKASNIANKIAEVFSKEVDKIYNLENISILDEAAEEVVPYNINFAKQMIIYVGVTLVLSCAFIFVMFYFNDTIKSKREIETKLNLAVLGEIPLMNKANLKADYYSNSSKHKKRRVEEDEDEEEKEDE